jgi:hypothetical protein
MKVGDKVRVSLFITADPYGKAGQVGKLTDIRTYEDFTLGIITFADDSVGVYDVECLEPINETF